MANKSQTQIYTYQSDAKSVLIEYAYDFSEARLYVSDAHESIASWYKYQRPDLTVPMSAEQHLIDYAATIAPIFNGSSGPVLQVNQITTGAF